ncbi:MAG: caspase family protein, partial [Bradyrhizobium sp.]|nr:caspase family protein [Bradyrhizobium sp.]
MPLFRLTLFSTRLLAGLVAGLLTAAPAHAQSAAATPLALTGPEQRIALVIGNSKYQNTVQLSNPGNDTKAVAQLLTSAGFEVISATDL